MTTRVEKSIVVNVPVSTAYNQWTQFEEFPRFMTGVQKVTQISNDRLEWFAEIAGVERQWTAKILEQVPDRKVAWAAVDGAVNAGAVTFEDLGDRTEVHLSLEFEPEGVLERIGDRLHLVEKQAEGDLERFKSFIEAQAAETGAWRGSIGDGGVGTPGARDSRAAQSGDDIPGASGAAVTAGTAAIIGAGAAGAGAPALSEQGGAREDLSPGTAGTGDAVSGASTDPLGAGTPYFDDNASGTGIGDTVPNDNS